MKSLNEDLKTGQLSIYFNIILFAVCLTTYDLTTIMYSTVFVAILYTVADHFHSQNITRHALVINK